MLIPLAIQHFPPILLQMDILFHLFWSIKVAPQTNADGAKLPQSSTQSVPLKKFKQFEVVQ